MKYTTLLLFFFASFFATTNSNAQFKLKKLDNVVVSMSEGESIDNYTKYLSGYFDRIDILESMTNMGNFTLITEGEKKFLQGQATNEQNQKVVFRIQVSVSTDKLTIKKVDDFKTVACVAKSCVDCAFKDDYDCSCNGEGECEQNISM